MTPRIEFRFLLAAFALSGCATTALPPVSVDHPASPAATEGMKTPRNALGRDAATTRTRQLLDGTAKPAESSTDDSMGDMPGMNH